MRFLHLDLFHKEVEFGNIEGYDDIKDIIRRALDADENYNLLLCGPPASAKTLFLLGTLECRNGVYFDASNTTNRILDVLEEERPSMLHIYIYLKPCSFDAGHHLIGLKHNLIANHPGPSNHKTSTSLDFSQKVTS